MGRTKSWLALVLAIVMVLGMAVPTAFAAVIDRKIAFYDASATPTPATVYTGRAGTQANPIKLYLGDKASEFAMYDGTDGKSAAFKLIPANMGVTKIVPTITGGSTAVELVVSDAGKVTISPKAVTAKAVKFTVAVDHEKGKTWGGDWTSPNDFHWEDDLYVEVLPVATFTPGSISLDLKTQGKKTTNVDASYFTSTTAGTVEFRGLFDSEAAAIAGTTQTNVKTLVDIEEYTTSIASKNLLNELTAKAVGQMYAYANVYVGGKQARPVKIQLSVGNAAEAKGYQVGSETTAINVQRNALAAKYDLVIYAADANGTKLEDRKLTLTDGTDLIVTVDEVVVKPSGTKTITASSAAATNGYTISLAPHADVISAKGTLTMKAKSVKEADGSDPVDILPLTIPFTITPVTFSSDVRSNLTFDLDAAADPALNTQIASFSAATGSTLSNVTFDGLDAAITTSRPDITNSPNKYMFTANMANPPKENSGKIVAYGQVALKTATADLGTTAVWAGPIEVPYIVKPNTKIPVITGYKDTIDIDMNDAATITNNMTLNATGTLGTGSLNITVDTANAVYSDDFSAANATVSYNSTTRLLTVKGVKRGSGTITLSGTAGLGATAVKFNDIVIKVNVDDKKSGKAHHFTTSNDNIVANVDGSVADLTVKMVDFDGVQIPGSSTAVTSMTASVLTEKKAAFSGTAPITVTPSTANADMFKVSIVKAGKGFIMIDEYTTGTKTAEPLYIPFEIKAMSMTADKESVLLDTKTAASAKTSVTLTATSGSFTDLTATVGVTNYTAAELKTGITVVTGLTVKDITETGVTNKKVLEFVGTKAVAEGKITFGARIGGFDAGTVEVTYEVENTTAIIPNPAKLELSMEDGKNKDGYITVTSNVDNGGSPYAPVVSTYVSGTPAVATIEKTSTTNKYYVKAVSDGTAVITITGTVNGAAAEPATVTVTVGKSTAVTLVPTPTSATLYMKSAKDNEVTFTAKGSDGTAATDLEFAAYTGDIVKVEGLKVTGLKAGSATLTLTGKVNGVTLTTPITITVKDEVAPDFKAGLKIGDKIYVDGDEYQVPNNYKIIADKVVIVNADGSEITDVTLTQKLPKGKKTNRLVIKGTTITGSGTFGEMTLTATPKLAGANPISVKLKVVRMPDDGTIVPVQGLENPQAGTREYFFNHMYVNPQAAYYNQPKYWTFSSNKKSVATVSSKGVISFLKAGDVTITAKKKSDNKTGAKSKLEVTFKVTDEYVKSTYRGVVLSNSAKKADILAVMNAVKFPMGGGAQAFSYDAAGYDAMIAYLKANAGVNDVSAVYIDGAITKSGFTVGTKEVKLTDLAGDLAQVPGKIFLTLNGAGSTMYSSKGDEATPADIAKVFALAELAIQDKATAMSTVGTNGFWSSQKFYVLSATEKASQSVSTSKAAEFESAFITAMTLDNTGKYFNSTDRITLKELYTKVKAISGKKIGYYPSNVTGVVVGYNYTSTVTP